MPRRGLEFVTRKITWHAAAIKLGLRRSCGSATSRRERDWGYAKDYVEAMWLMLQQDEPDDYVDRHRRGAHGARVRRDRLRPRRPATGEDHVVIDDAFKRPAEVDLLVGDASKAERMLGWEPRTSFEELIALMVDADLQRLG